MIRTNSIWFNSINQTLIKKTMICSIWFDIFRYHIFYNKSLAACVADLGCSRSDVDRAAPLRVGQKHHKYWNIKLIQLSIIEIPKYKNILSNITNKSKKTVIPIKFNWYNILIQFLFYSKSLAACVADLGCNRSGACAAPVRVGQENHTYRNCVSIHLSITEISTYKKTINYT